MHTHSRPSHPSQAGLVRLLLVSAVPTRALLAGATLGREIKMPNQLGEIDLGRYF